MTGESHRGDRGANSSLVHRGVERLYHRRGPRVLLSAVAVCCLIVALAGMVVTVMLAGYLEISSGEQARAFGVASLFVFAGIGIGLWRVRDTTRTILSWQARRTDPARAIGHGLSNMADRIGALGGELEIMSTPGVGTTVRGRVPV